ncbi:MAG TPA: polyprenol phosphomannose-dependent alpha 1,6 mannosyltransferase MptB [Jatrophihabitans sp.]|nr:polyprenol phosphomannose-dependent alpha 1,6 mannosyltransferase MptB [Jatrophihabitans sp.]
MNDLAELALRGLAAARRQISTHFMLTLGTLGFAVACVTVVAGGQVDAGEPTHPVTTWLGLEKTFGVRLDNWVPGAVLFAGIVALVLLWLTIVRLVRRRDPPERRLWSVAAVWALPFALGPPLMGTTVQTYVAYGLLQRHGHDPYHFGPNRMTDEIVVSAIEPSARSVPSSAGPLGTLIQHLAVSASAGNALGALVVLRVLAVFAAVAIGRLAADLAGTYRAQALTLTLLNPLLLLYIVSAARLEGVMIALVLASLRAAKQRRWPMSIALAALGGSVLAPAFLLLPVLITAHVLGARRAPAWLLLGRDLVVAAAVVLAAGFVVTDGFGWLWTVDNQFSAHTPYSVAGAVATLLTPVVRGASYDDLAAGGRITAMTAMVCVVVYLLVTVRQRPLERTAGYALLALALLGPVLYPWYLLWGTMCLAPTAAARNRALILILCAAGCVLYPPGFTPLTSDVITGIAIGVLAVVVAGLLVRRHSSEPVSAGT